MASPHLHVTSAAHAPLAARYAAYSGPYMPAAGSPDLVGGTPVQVVTSDLAGRRIQDLVTVNTSASSVSILSGNGDGSFQAKRDYQVGAAPVAIGIGDVNGDGHADLVTVNSGADTISLLVGTGDGTFQPKRDYPVGARPSGLALGDFDGDGNLDIAVTATRWNSLTVLLNDGQGGFRTLTQAIGYQPTAIAAADFDRDGNLDLAIGGATAVVIWLGDNNGGFDPVRRPPPAASNPTSIAVADLNGDGIVDLVFANSGNNSIATYLGRGDGTFNRAAGSPIAVGVSPTTVRLGDLNGDNVLDLAFTSSGSNSASFWYGDGKGGFRGAPGSPVTISSSPVGLALGDFNRDGRLDLAVSEAASNRVAVMLANSARGSVFSLVASSASPYEEADVFVSADGRSNALSYEGGL